MKNISLLIKIIFYLFTRIEPDIFYPITHLGDDMMI